MPSRDGDGKVYSDVGSSNPLQDVIIVLLYQAYPYPPHKLKTLVHPRASPHQQIS